MDIIKLEKVQHMLAYIEQNKTKDEYEKFVRILNYYDDMYGWYEYLKSTYMAMVK